MKMRIFKNHAFLSIVFVLFLTFLTNHLSFAYTAATIAQNIIFDAGEVVSSWEGKSRNSIIIFEEMHTSRVGQIEIALMLTRLYNRYHIRKVALEGAFRKDGALEVSWFYRLSDTYVREEVVLQLLREGEVNAAEFITLAIPEVKVHGVEEEKEYTFELSPPLDENSSVVYLYAIAEGLFPKNEEKIANFNRLSKNLEEAADKDKPVKIKKIMDYVINLNQWTKERYRKLTAKNNIISVEKLLVILKEIKAKAEEVNADVGEYKENLINLIAFYERASKRSETIIAHTLKLFDEKKNIPLPLIIGAAHTSKACELLKRRGISHTVVRPKALVEKKDVGDLLIEAFERKQKKLSVDEKGLIGSFIDGRWKPRPVVGELWVKSKSELYYVSDILAEAVARGERPPFNKLKNELSNLKYVEIDTKAFKVIGNELIFKAEVQTNNPDYKEIIWGRTVMIAAKYRKESRKESLEVSLEERIKKILDESRKKGIEIQEKKDLKITKISRHTIAAFSKKPEVVTAVRLGG